MTMWQPSTRYPDPAVQILHPSFAKYPLMNAAVERLATGCRWAEGPVWFGDARCLLWSDIPNDRILRWDLVVYGMSDNPATFWDNRLAGILGYRPVDSSEEHREK